MEFIDPVQRHQRIEPFFKSLHQYKESQDEDNESDFEDYLDEAVDVSTSLPEDLELAVNRLKTLYPYNDEELSIITMNFNRHGLQLIHDIYFRLSRRSFEFELLEKEVLMVANALFMLSFQYGVMMALYALIDMWTAVELGSLSDRKIKTYFLKLAKPNIPLLAFKKKHTRDLVLERDTELKICLKELLIHRVIEERAKPIIDVIDRDDDVLIIGEY